MYDHVENLKPGDSVFIIKTEADRYGYVEYSGIPFRVEFIDIPFILATHVPSGDVTTIDIRKNQIKKTQPGYAKIYNEKEGRRCPNCQSKNLNLAELGNAHKQQAFICTDCGHICL